MLAAIAALIMVLFLDIKDSAIAGRMYQGLISRTIKKAIAPLQAANAAMVGLFKNGIIKK